MATFYPGGTTFLWNVRTPRPQGFPPPAPETLMVEPPEPVEVPEGPLTPRELFAKPGEPALEEDRIVFPDEEPVQEPVPDLAPPQGRFGFVVIRPAWLVRPRTVTFFRVTRLPRGMVPSQAAPEPAGAGEPIEAPSGTTAAKLAAVGGMGALALIGLAAGGALGGT